MPQRLCVVFLGRRVAFVLLTHVHAFLLRSGVEPPITIGSQPSWKGIRTARDTQVSMGPPPLHGAFFLILHAPPLGLSVGIPAQKWPFESVERGDEKFGFGLGLGLDLALEVFL